MRGEGFEKVLELNVRAKRVYGARACDPGHLFSQFPGWRRHDRGSRSVSTAVESESTE